jgi:hypothetical protein
MTGSDGLAMRRAMAGAADAAVSWFVAAMLWASVVLASGIQGPSRGAAVATLACWAAMDCAWRSRMWIKGTSAGMGLMGLALEWDGKASAKAAAARWILMIGAPLAMAAALSRALPASGAGAGAAMAAIVATALAWWIGGSMAGRSPWDSAAGTRVARAGADNEKNQEKIT